MKKENDKYYVPSLEEFHIGFEYERFVPKSNCIEKDCWDKIIMSVNYLTLDEIDDEIIKKEIRVKYLDKEDIESLEFKLYPSLLFKKGNIFISFGHEKYIQINNAKDVFFQGIIKNKSELKRLLKQLEIIN